MSDELVALGETYSKLGKQSTNLDRRLKHAAAAYFDKKYREDVDEDVDSVKLVFGTSKKGKKTEKPAVSESKIPVKKQKVKPTDDEPFECAGNVEAGTPCPADSEENNVRVADTKFDGKSYASCKACKKAIKNARRKKEKTEKK
jgi:hypothetical protein